MKHRWTTLCGSCGPRRLSVRRQHCRRAAGFHTCPALVLPRGACPAAVPTAWAAWALFAEPPDPLPPERLLGPVSEFDLAALCDLEQPAAVPIKRAKQKPLCRRSGTGVLFVNQKAIKRSC